MNKVDKELVHAIVGGEMRNAWQKEDRPGQDTRPDDWKTIDRRARSSNYQDNYKRIFGHD